MFSVSPQRLYSAQRNESGCGEQGASSEQGGGSCWSHAQTFALGQWVVLAAHWLSLARVPGAAELPMSVEPE